MTFIQKSLFLLASLLCLLTLTKMSILQGCSSAQFLEFELISYTVFWNWNWNFYNPTISSLIHSAKILFSAFQATENLDKEPAKKEKNKKKKAAAKERKRERQEKAAEAPEAKKAKKAKKGKKAKKNKKNK